MQVNIEETIDKAREELTELIAIYDSLIEQVEKICDTCNLNSEWVLRAVFPLKAIERRDSTRIAKWFSSEKKSIIKAIESHNEKCRRKEIIESLSLTPEQIQIIKEM